MPGTGGEETLRLTACAMDHGGDGGPGTTVSSVHISFLGREESPPIVIDVDLALLHRRPDSWSAHKLLAEVRVSVRVRIDAVE